VKKLFAIVVTAVFLVVALVQWHAYRAASANPPSVNQIIIHGTPVCIFSQDGNIMARIGQCPDAPQTDNEGSPERAPYHGQPGMDLPPGHPPVDRDMFPDGRRTIPI
jgi:hypothetical protein